MATFDNNGQKKGANTPLIIAASAVGAVVSLVLIVALLSGHPTNHDADANNTTNDLTNTLDNDANNAVVAPANTTQQQTADSNAVFDPSGPNPLVTNDASVQFLDAATMNANATAAEKAGNDTLAAEWWALSAAKGDAAGQAGLGVAFALGHGVKEDDQIAFALFEKSADQGNMDGEEWEGSYYQHGYGIPVDLTKARYWYEKSAAQGDTYAQDWLTKNPN